MLQMCGGGKPLGLQGSRREDGAQSVGLVSSLVPVSVSWPLCTATTWHPVSLEGVRLDEEKAGGCVYI